MHHVTKYSPAKNWGISKIVISNWHFSCYSMPIHWLVSWSQDIYQWNCFPPNAMSRQHCENYDVKQETVHCYLRNVNSCCVWSEVAWCCRWNLSTFFKICFCFVLLFNKSLNDWSRGEQWILFPQFSKLHMLQKYLKGNKHSSLHLAGKYARIFVFGHYLFLEACSFPQATLPENCSLRGQIMSAEKPLRIFSSQMDVIVYIFSPKKRLI